MKSATVLLAQACLCSVLWAAPASADVLEIDGTGHAKWLTRHSTGPANDAAHRDVTDEASHIPDSAVLSANQQNVPDIYSSKVAELAARYDLSPALIEALVWQESRWRASAVSPVGARGLAQLMPGTARDMGIDPDDPMENLEGGARYLRTQLDRFDGDIEKALAAYNAGPGRVLDAGGVPHIRETQNYVASVMGRLSNQARSSK